jgi:adenylate cyclase
MAEERAERRLAAILATDVVGYSRLMGEDETGTLARLQALRKELLHPKVAEYGGRIVKTTGDGTLIEFPSAVDAVQHAVEVQTAIEPWQADTPVNQRIEFRMGINVGDIIVEEDDIFGDGVNVAARLEGIAEPGGICISGTVFDQIKGKLDLPIEDMGEQQVKNIAEPVRTYRIDLGSLANSNADSHSPAADTGFLEKPALAVLPFENLSGDPEQAYFADGLTEDIITALSLWRSFPVIARNSTFVYKGESVNIQEVGQALGARYVLEGSVRKSGDRVRVTAQLIDADTGHHVWAERFDRQFEDIFDLQDDLTQKIAAIVAPELERVGHNRVTLNQPQNLDAWSLVQRGLALSEEFTKEANSRSREMFGEALKLDRTYSRAYSGLALTYARALMSGYEASREAAADKALEAARQAVAFDSSDSLAHTVLGIALTWAERRDDAILSLRRAVELNPSHGYARGSLGTLLDLTGHTEEGISLMEEGLRLNPNAPSMMHINSFLARACLNARQYEKAVEWARKAINAGPKYQNAYYILAVSLAYLDRDEEARAALDRCERIEPGFIATRAQFRPYEDSAANDHIIDGFHKAGWKA